MPDAVSRWEIGTGVSDQRIPCQPNKLRVELLVDTERRVEVVPSNVDVHGLFDLTSSGQSPNGEKSRPERATPE